MYILNKKILQKVDIQVGSMLKRVQTWMNVSLWVRYHTAMVFTVSKACFESSAALLQSMRRTRESVIRISWWFSVSGVRTLSAMCLHNLKGRAKAARPEPDASMSQEHSSHNNTLKTTSVPNNPLRIITIIIALLTICIQDMQCKLFMWSLFYCIMLIIVAMMYAVMGISIKMCCN